MATKIVTKNSSTASAVPTASDLVQGELAVNVADKRLFTEDNAGAIVELGTNPYNFTANHNGSTKIATTATGIDVTGTVVADGIESSGNFVFTAADGMQISAKESVVINIDSDDNDSSRVFTVSSGSSESLEILINASEDAGVTLYHDNAAKIATTSTGIDVTGTATVDGLISSNVSGTTLIQAVGVDSNGFADVEIKSTGTSGASRLYFSDTAAQSGSIKYSHSDNSMQFDTAATQAMRIDSSGRVGIGTSSFADANARLVVSNGTINLEHYLYTAGSIGYIGTRTNHDLGFTSNGQERMRIDSSGNVGIGVSPSATLDIAGDNQYNRISSYFSGSYTSGFKFSDLNGGIWYDAASDDLTVSASLANSQLILESGGSESARIDSSGNLLVGTTSTGNPNVLGIENTGQTNYGIVIKNKNTLVDDAIGFINSSNTRVGFISFTTSATTYNTSSDQRLKDNIVDAPSASDDIDAIQVRSFDWKADGSHQKYGMVAQELQSVAPIAVTGDADSEEMMGVDYSKLVPMLIKEIQSLRNRVAQLEE